MWYQYLWMIFRLIQDVYKRQLSDRFINEITSLPVHSITSIDVVPVPKDLTTKVLQKQYLGIESDIIKQQRVRNKNNDFSTEISYAKRTEKKEIEEIMDDVRENDQCLFFVGVTTILMAESKKELESVCETVETIGKRNSCTIDTHYLKQREALNTALPIGVRQVETMRTLLTQSLAVLMPFNVQELNDSTGNYYGINQISKNVNIGNRKKLINGNGFVFGAVSYTHLDVYKRQSMCCSLCQLLQFQYSKSSSHCIRYLCDGYCHVLHQSEKLYAR